MFVPAAYHDQIVVAVEDAMGKRWAPLRNFDGWAKQVDLNELPDVARLALKLIFPHLIPPSREAVDERTEELRKSTDATRVLPVYVNRRRFAGDFSLGPQRYYTLASGSNGNDDGTLLAELAAYTVPRINDCILHEQMNEEWTAAHGIPYQKNSIFIQLLGTPGSNALIAQIGTNGIHIPFKVTKLKIPNVVDLRHPSTQEWFCREFGDFYRHVGVELDRMAKKDKKPSSALPRPTTLPSSFLDMLPVLMDPTNGGNTVTDHIGQVLRFHEVAALIYPSARTIVGVRWADGTLQYSRGWNLVDYQGTKRQCFEGLTLILGQDPWFSENTRYFESKKLDNENSWIMFPPKRDCDEIQRFPSDQDLMARYSGGRKIFRILVEFAFKIMSKEEIPWLEAMETACAMPPGQKVTEWMGISEVRHLSEDLGYDEPCILFECARADTKECRISKGFSCLAAPPSATFDSLDKEPGSYIPGTPVFRALEEGLFIFYLRENLPQSE